MNQKSEKQKHTEPKKWETETHRILKCLVTTWHLLIQLLYNVMQPILQYYICLQGHTKSRKIFYMFKEQKQKDR